MDKQLAEEIVGCLPQGRTCFNYYPERYAWLLLRHVVGEGTPIAALKQSPFAGLLHKPRVKHWLAGLGSKALTAADVLAADCDPDPLHFVLTLGYWQGQQTSRPGSNLVLQLNFDRKHDARYQTLIQPKPERTPFGYYGHPVNQTGRNTLAWARLDVDMDQDEVLIEEIQTDWIRRALRADERPNRVYGSGGSEAEIRQYTGQLLAQYQKVWAEAMLAAAIWFIREELGIRRMFYHSPHSNQRLKGLEWGEPPRSLYTDLPRQFCFRPSQEVPHFLRKKRSKIARNWPFYQLTLQGLAA